MASPLEQFAIRRYADIEVAGIDAAFTNSSLFMLITLGLIGLFFFLGTRNAGLVPHRWQAALEAVVGFIDDMVEQNVGPQGRAFVPLVFALFLFILVANVLGLFPYSFTVTSHIAVTFAFAALVFLLCVAVGVARHGAHFLSLFVPANTPWPLLFLIVPIEIISFLSRPLTLGIRLFANMTAGHILLKVFAGFVISLGAAGGVLSLLAPVPFVLTVAFFALELLVAVVQAYVFSLLVCIYLNDSVNLHH
ncbi:MAG: F0F1 ATP synthase subunit A [Sphingomonadaceae bacterium]|uniref:F0F1 ATP synthase subunit A n=1 Tax=Thermaurantiacus sp. TaxID=2820283 RepID=UPI00298F030A|nr:F0F1 ATP synthase subunit A [Thermaurantiacus sp.]MCS6987874.1 F0F1 ATP synthase subunit A [Sphingomonadaceae bacterium]MDW8414906.1 F0F1 ATP synthase subunit A [Thermaurantiacus sp.]